MAVSVYGKWLLKEKPNAKLAILYQNDDLGKDYARGLKAALGEKARPMVVAEASYETSGQTAVVAKDVSALLFKRQRRWLGIFRNDSGTWDTAG